MVVEKGVSVINNRWLSDDAFNFLSNIFRHIYQVVEKGRKWLKKADSGLNKKKSDGFRLYHDLFPRLFVYLIGVLISISGFNLSFLKTSPPFCVSSHICISYASCSEVMWTWRLWIDWIC